MARGRFEFQLKTDAAWTVSGSDDSGAWGPVTVIATATTTYATDLAALLEAATADAGAGATDTYTVTTDFGESGTGKVTIDCDAANPWDLTWVETNLRDALGFAGNIVNASTPQTGTIHAGGVWLPDQIKITLRGDNDDGTDETDAVTTESPTGAVKTLYGQRRTSLAAEYRGVSAARVLVSQESTTNESWQYQWRNFVLGESAYGQVGPPTRLGWVNFIVR